MQIIGSIRLWGLISILRELCQVGELSGLVKVAVLRRAVSRPFFTDVSDAMGSISSIGESADTRSLCRVRKLRA